MIFEWSKTYAKTFQMLKIAMMTMSILRHFDRTRKIILKINFSDHINVEVLLQYDDENVLHSVAFYFKNMLSIECNYEIYNKKLLVIVRCLKHWRSELKFIELLIKIFIDHKFLKHFMIIKKLIRRQIQWIEKLSEYNFKIHYQSRIKNVKIDILIKKSDDVFFDLNNARLKYQYQIILILDWLQINSLKLNVSTLIHDRILNVNRNDEICSQF